MYQVQDKYFKKHPATEWRYELRIRYLPTSLHDLYDKDKVTFFFYYDQVSAKHFKRILPNLSNTLKL